MFFYQSVAIRNAIGVLVVGLALAAPADATVFRFDPSAIGLNGDAFTADALKADEVSHIVFSDATHWTEHGYARITGAQFSGGAVATTGLNSTYTLYLDFGGTGDMATNTFSSATMTLFGVDGLSTFGIDGNNDAHVENPLAPIVLANASLVWGTTGQTVIDPGSSTEPPKIDFFADLLTTFTPVAAYAGFFAQPADFFSLTSPLYAFGNFFHAAPGVYFPVTL